MALGRIFFDWDRPALPQVAEYLGQRFAEASEIDLSHVVLVVPGSQAGRRLMELLVQHAGQQGRMLLPPRVKTAGELPELLYQARRPFASHLVQQLAWIEALRRSDPALCQSLLPAWNETADLPARLALGEMLGRLHRELAADGLDFAAVAACGARVAGFREETRWQALATLQQEYLAVLDELELWDRQTARLYAIRHGECCSADQILLIGTVDLNGTQRLMLDQVADQVTALVFAPEAWAQRFDEHGCLRPEAWQDVRLPLANSQIELVDSPADQAAAAVRAIAGLNGRYSAQEIVVGVPDEQLVPYLQQQLVQCGLRARYGAGSSLARSGPYRLLSAVADCLQSPRYAALAGLVRQPDAYHWLQKQFRHSKTWLSALDRFYSEHLPHEVDEKVVGSADAVIAEVQAAVAGLLRPLRGRPRPLAQWAGALAELLLTVLPADRRDSSQPGDRGTLDACEQIGQILQSQAEVPPALMPAVNAQEAIRVVLDELARTSVPPPADHEAIGLRGWLELPLEDVPAMIVTGLNEGIVPSSLNADLFLPNQLRRALGIEDNQRRCARDAYALSLMAHGRPVLHVIAGRRNAEGDPLAPSRLLFACDDQDLAGRVQRFFGERSARGSEPPLGLLQPGQARSAFEIPRPQPLPEPITSMRVTEFRDYLGCPYRYYLRHALKLERLSDAAQELDGGGFGSLAHAVLDRFGRGPMAAATDPELIQAFLNAALDEEARSLFQAPLPAVLVQIEQLRLRLAAFARWQADWAKKGWQIERVEAQIGAGLAELCVDGAPMGLRGRIDRIDVHARTGQRVVFDYKTSDTVKTPEQTHRRKGEWIDLQLPLYRHLVTALGVAGPVEVGYIVLPKDTSHVGELMAPWGEADLAAADRTAQSVIRGVRSQRFWPPADPPPAFSEEFSAICQDSGFGAVLAVEGEESA